MNVRRVQTKIDATTAEAIERIVPGVSLSQFTQIAILNELHRLARQKQLITNVAGMQEPEVPEFFGPTDFGAA